MGDTSDAYGRIRSLLDADGCRVTVHEHEPVVTVAEAVERVPELTETLLKTIVFRKKDGLWILAGLLHTDRVDYKKLATAVNVNRRDLRPVAAEILQAKLGFEVGGVGPFPAADNTEVVIDDAALGMSSVVCGSGRNTRSIEIGVSDLVRVTSAIVAPISKAK
ncbi:MAG: YbaK/EbsC family protein [Woeseiaceae bacterium]